MKYNKNSEVTLQACCEHEEEKEDKQEEEEEKRRIGGAAVTCESSTVDNVSEILLSLLLHR